MCGLGRYTSSIVWTVGQILGQANINGLSEPGKTHPYPFSLFYSDSKIQMKRSSSLIVAHMTTLRLQTSDERKGVVQAASRGTIIKIQMLIILNFWDCVL